MTTATTDNRPSPKILHYTPCCNRNAGTVTAGRSFTRTCSKCKTRYAVTSRKINRTDRFTAWEVTWTPVN